MYRYTLNSLTANERQEVPLGLQQLDSLELCSHDPGMLSSVPLSVPYVTVVGWSMEDSTSQKLPTSYSALHSMRVPCGRRLLFTYPCIHLFSQRLWPWCPAQTVNGLIGNLRGNSPFHRGVAGVGGHVRQNLRQGAILELVSSS